MKSFNNIVVLTALLGLSIGLTNPAYSAEGTIQHGDPWTHISGNINPTYLVTSGNGSFFQPVDRLDDPLAPYDAVTARRINVNGLADILLPDTLLAVGSQIIFDPATGQFITVPGNRFAVYSIDTSNMCDPVGALPGAFGIQVSSFSVEGVPMSSRPVISSCD